MWDRLIDWSAANPARRKALKQLKVSDRIGAESRRCGEGLFADFKTVLEEALAGHAETASRPIISARCSMRSPKPRSISSPGSPGATTITARSASRPSGRRSRADLFAHEMSDYSLD